MLIVSQNLGSTIKSEFCTNCVFGLASNGSSSFVLSQQNL
jgi:hypothetical protein